MRSTDLVAVFGLLEPRPVPEVQPLCGKIYNLDSFTVRVYGEAAQLTCKCGRYDSFYLHVLDLERSHPSIGLYACPICLNELRNARSHSDRVAVWLTQNRSTITKDQHLYLPKCKVIMRPMRFVYTSFFKIQLSTKDKVLRTCSDSNCVNPYHLMVTASTATKLTPDMKQDVLLWLTKEIKPQTIQQLLEAKYNRSLSARTITNLRKSLPV
jgi:hypothetical protein